MGNFTRSPTEHIINRIEKPFLVRAVRGTVIRKEGFREPLQGVLFEIRGLGTDQTVRQGTTDGRGQFRINHAPTGTYEFKATLNGFQSVTGTLTISKAAGKKEQINIEMLVGV